MMMVLISVCLNFWNIRVSRVNYIKRVFINNYMKLCTCFKYFFVIVSVTTEVLTLFKSKLRYSAMRRNSAVDRCGSFYQGHGFNPG